MERIKKNRIVEFSVLEVFVLIGIIAVTLIGSRYYYDLTHLVIYGYRFIIAVILHVIAKHTIRLSQNHYFYLVSIVILSIGIFDLLHAIVIPGFNIINLDNADVVSFNYYYFARIFECTGLFIIPFLIGKKINSRIWDLVFIVFIVGLTSFVYFKSDRLFDISVVSDPIGYIEKIVYSLLLIGSIIVHLKNRRLFQQNVINIIIYAIIILNISNILNIIVPEVNRQMHIVSSLVGSIAYYLLFKAMIRITLRNPLEALFFELFRKEEELIRHRDELEMRVEMRTAEIMKMNIDLENEIQERQKAITELKQARTLFAAALEQNPSGILVVDSDGLTVRAINRKFLDILHLKEEMINTGMRLSDFHPPWEYLEPFTNDHDPELSPIMRTIIGQPLQNTEFRIRLPEGNEINLLVSTASIKDENDEIQAVLLVVTDITLSKSTYKKLEESEALYRTLINTSPDAITLTDIDGKLVFISPKIKDLFGYPDVSFALGKNPIEFIDRKDQPRAQTAMAHLLKGRKDFTDVYRLSKMDGTIFYGEITSETVSDSKGKPYAVLSIIRDITNRRKAEEMMDRLMSELEAKNMELESIIYVTSHDLRSPLVNIQGFTNEILRGIEQLKRNIEILNCPGEDKTAVMEIVREDFKDSLNFIIASAEKMDILLKGLLKISRLGRIKIEFKPVDMNVLFQKIISTFRHTINQKSIRIEVTDLPVCIGSEEYLNQVFSNLIDNAIKYRHPERDHVIKIDAEIVDGNVIYIIEDNGIGIAPAYLSKIFDIFNRLNPRGEINGEGLGLSIVRRIVDKHKGRVWAESDGKTGSRFLVRLRYAN